VRPPQSADLASLGELGPTFLSFALSFVYVAIYWNNHHHFFRLVPHVSGAVMWAKLNLLFWRSLIALATAWMDEHSDASVPIAICGRSCCSERSVGGSCRHDRARAGSRPPMRAGARLSLLRGRGGVVVGP
jgi:hypothetical protein